MTECIWFNLAKCNVCRNVGLGLFSKNISTECTNNNKLDWLSGGQADRLEWIQCKLHALHNMHIRSYVRTSTQCTWVHRFILDTRETSYQLCWCYFIHSTLSEVNVFSSSFDSVHVLRTLLHGSLFRINVKPKDEQKVSVKKCTHIALGKEICYFGNSGLFKINFYNISTLFPLMKVF